MMRILLLVSLTVLSAVRLASGEQIQSDAPERTLAAPANMTFGTAAGVASGELRPGVPRLAVQFLLDATSDQKNGTVALGWKSGQQSHFLLTMTGPLDSGTQQAAPISLLGLPTGASIKLSASRLNWRGPSGLEQLETQRLCEDLAKRGISPCQTDNENIPLLERTALRQLSHVDDTPWFIGGDVGIERAAFRFLEPGTLAARSKNHETYTASGRLGYYSDALGFVIGSYAYRRSHAPAGSPADICQVIDGTTALRCQPAVIGAPAPRRLSVASVELRKFFAAPIAISPSVQRDFEKDITAVDVPLYFLKTGSSLTGGVRFGWRSDTKEVAAVVFVGTAIGLLPR
jgi:hypothetical protein